MPTDKALCLRGLPCARERRESDLCRTVFLSNWISDKLAADRPSTPLDLSAVPVFAVLCRRDTCCGGGKRLYKQRIQCVKYPQRNGGEPWRYRSVILPLTSRPRPPKARSTFTIGSEIRGPSCSRIPKTSRPSAPPNWVTWRRSSPSSTSAE